MKAMLKHVVFVLAAVLVPSVASAQWSFYGGGTVTAELSGRGAFDSLGTYPTAGVLTGFRFHDAWSIELHIDRGFGKSTVDDRPGSGRAFYFTWKSRQPRRVGVALTLGASMRRFSSYRESTGIFDREVAAGWSGGVLFPIALGHRWSVAPELRLGLGFTGEHGTYAQVSPGVRVMWGF